MPRTQHWENRLFFLLLFFPLKFCFSLLRRVTSSINRHEAKLIVIIPEGILVFTCVSLRLTERFTLGLKVAQGSSKAILTKAKIKLPLKSIKVELLHLRSQRCQMFLPAPVINVYYFIRRICNFLECQPESKNNGVFFSAPPSKRK